MVCTCMYSLVINFIYHTYTCTHTHTLRFTHFVIWPRRKPSTNSKTSYYKFVIVRNPLEWLLSAYHNKLESPFNYLIRRNFLKGYKLISWRSIREKTLKPGLPTRVHITLPIFTPPSQSFYSLWLDFLSTAIMNTSSHLFSCASIVLCTMTFPQLQNAGVWCICSYVVSWYSIPILDLLPWIHCS